MNILFFTQNYPKSYDEAIVSGMVKNPFYLSQYLQKAGHRVTVITSGNKQGEWEFYPVSDSEGSQRKVTNGINGVEVYSIGRGVFKGVVHAFWMETKMFFKFLSLRKENNFDIIHIHHLNILFVLFLRKLKIITQPVIYTAHGTSTPELRASHQGGPVRNLLLRINGKAQHFIDKISWRNADKVISPSKFQVKEMVQMYKVSEGKIKVIYNGVDNTRFFPNSDVGARIRKELGVSKRAPLVLYVGRIARKKGIHILLKNAKNVIKRLPRTRFLLVLGNIGRQLDYKKEILQLIENENLQEHIIIKENVPEKTLPAYYNAADVCVFPSIGYESIPTVIYEAMACSKPIITQGSWGITEVLGETLLSEQDLQTAMLSEHIVNILSKKELQAASTEQNTKKINKFYWSEVSRQHVELYKHIIMNASRTHS